MDISDPHECQRWLETVGYYRLSAYWLPFETGPSGEATRSKTFKEGVSFENVTDLYVFDRRIRNLILEAIERVEIHVRSRWTYHMSHEHGAHAHLKPEIFDNTARYAEQLVRLTRSIEKSEETFIVHYRQKYSQPSCPPLWAVTELMTFGELSKWFQATNDRSIQSKIAKELGLPTREVAESVLQVLAYTRNICAHHGRLWNRRFVKRLPKIKRKPIRANLIIETDKGREVVENRLYNIMVILLYMLDQQNTDSTFRDRLIQILSEVSHQTLTMMGFPADWRLHSIWNGPAQSN